MKKQFTTQALRGLMESPCARLGVAGTDDPTSYRKIFTRLWQILKARPVFVWNLTMCDVMDHVSADQYVAAPLTLFRRARGTWTPACVIYCAPRSTLEREEARLRDAFESAGINLLCWSTAQIDDGHLHTCPARRAIKRGFYAVPVQSAAGNRHRGVR